MSWRQAPFLKGEVVVGRTLFDIGADEEVLKVQRDLHRQILERRQSLVSFEYRCDAPDMVRRMRMSLMPLIVVQQIAAVLYQSIILEQVARPPMTLFERLETGERVTLCSYCHDVTWPVGEPATDAAWIEPEEYYRRGGTSEVVLSYGICPDCFTDLSLKMAH